MKCNLHACSEFWDDIKTARKGAYQKKIFESSLNAEKFASVDIESKIDSIEILRAISTFIQNTSNEPEKYSELLDRQPFIENGFIIYKLRYAADGKGKSQGLRVIFCLTKEPVIVFVGLKFKNAVEDEQKFEAEILWRIKKFLKVNGTEK